VSFFPKCHTIFDTHESLPSPSAFLPRVQHSGKIIFPRLPDFWHSGKKTTLGEFCFSRSVSSTHRNHVHLAMHART
jgi:hypothetical protein